METSIPSQNADAPPSKTKSLKMVHISDMHFGKHFNVPLWRTLRSQIEKFKPKILIISGDLVDHPSPLQLLAVKAELIDLAAACDHAEFYVVPGNHDVREWGNIVLPWRRRWFERIMFSDVSGTTKAIEDKLKITLRLNDRSRKISNLEKLIVRPLVAAIPRATTVDNADGRAQSKDLVKGESEWPIESINSSVAIASLNSNPTTGGRFAFASGVVSPDQLYKLGRYDANNAVLLRVAVMHHHPLPVSMARDDHLTMDQEQHLEPFLVLKNSGDVLFRLHQENFDLVLHGHKHRPQLARVQLDASNSEANSLLVVASGSTARVDEAARNNTARLITVAANGRISIRSYDAVFENRRPESFREPFEVLKRRMFSRFLKRTYLRAKRFDYRASIDSVGNVRIATRHHHMELVGGPDSMEGVPNVVRLPKYGIRFDELIRADDDSRRRVKIVWRHNDGTISSIPINGPTNTDGCCWIKFVEPLEPQGPTISYGVKSVMTNSIAMSAWEAEEWARIGERLAEKDFESISRYISYPIEVFEMHLTFPPELIGVTPELVCLRHQDYPNYPLGYIPQQATAINLTQFEVDEALSSHEARGLRHNVEERTWSVRIERPLPGYMYELRWRLNDRRASPGVCAATKAYQDIFREFGGRVRAGTQTTKDKECFEAFRQLSTGLLKIFKPVRTDQSQSVHLMIYDEKDIHLHAVVSDPALADGVDFKAPLGSGVSGAAFLRGDVVSWGDDPRSEVLIRPVPVPPPLPQPKYVLAIPVTHQIQRGDKSGRLNFEPGSIIGVVALLCEGSPSALSDDIRKKREEAQIIAQAAVATMLGKLLS